MNILGETLSIRRILVAVDASPQSLLALASAAQLAAHLQVELAGLFVEDIDLLRTADMPFVREVNRLSGAVQAIHQTDIVRQLKSQARQAQHALESAAIECQIKCSFRVVRGSVSQELVAAAEDVDLVTLGRVGWSPGQRLGSTAQTIMAHGSCLTLLHRSHSVDQLGITILFDGSKESVKALRIGAQIGAGRDITVMVLAIHAHDFQEKQKQAEAIFGALSNTVQFRSVSQLHDVTMMRNQDIVIVPASQDNGVLDLLDRLDCSVLLVR
ncbi:MAG: nucleotide-binding universal stress UspA family protein [Candidatus Latescibacterota bacterium]|jgi:nucleotide-binding universal stress UspA family protein